MLQIYNFLSTITNSKDLDESAYEVKYLWKLLVYHEDLDFYEVKSGQKSAKKNGKVSLIINDNVNRGYCANYFERKNVNQKVKKDKNGIMSYEDCLKE